MNIFDTIENIIKTKKVSYWFIIFLLSFLLGVYFFLLPTIRTKNILKKELENICLQTTINQKNILKKTAKAKKTHAYKKHLKTLQKNISVFEKKNLIFEYIDKILRKEGLTLLVFSPMQNAKFEFYEQDEYKIRFSGSYVNCKNFLKTLSTSKKIIQINKLSMTKSSKKNALIECSCYLVFYKLRALNN